MSLMLAVVLSMSLVSCFGDDDDDDEDPRQQQEEAGYNGGNEVLPDATVSGKIDGYKYVDMGTGVFWAVSNVGASFALDYGDYYQYGNPYAYSHAYESYSDNLPSYDITGMEYYDPARHNMGEKWRMPSYDDFYQLSKACEFKMVANKAGERYVQVKSKSNGNIMQIPLAGFYPEYNGSLLYEHYTGALMTGTLDNSGNPRPYVFKVSYINETSGSKMEMNTTEVTRLSRIPIRAVSTATPDFGSSF